MRIAITGANGFVGRHVIAALLAGQTPDEVRAIVRDPDRARGELTAAGLDVRRADVTDPASLASVFDGVDAVVHTVAIPTERHGSFERVNAEGTRAVVREAERAGVRKIVHLSAIGASPDSPYPFLRSKGQGQAAVASSAVPHVVLRPSVLFGPGDDFFPRLRFSLRFPIVPLPGGGVARFQPLHVDDLARAIVGAARGRVTGVFEVGGPAPVTYRELLAETMRAYRIRRPTVPLPVVLMKPAAFLFERLMGDPPVTVRQLDLLAVDNTPHPNAIDQVFGVRPRAFLGGGLSYLGQPAEPS
ncbi:MAG TPA: complex I NDUFA9 subunit family protein [Candidatus Saccharimonadales bacterium]|nr:complex I NDUFA9 subunit family protein [Candidatus Saccharimonadales bacterium]